MVRLRRPAVQVAVAIWLHSLWQVRAADQGENFVRGDVTAEQVVDLSDVVAILPYLFLGQPAELDCEDAADVDDDGSINIGDSLRLLFYLFEGDPKDLPHPFQACGKDSTPDDPLRCKSYWPCATLGSTSPHPPASGSGAATQMGTARRASPTRFCS